MRERRSNTCRAANVFGSETQDSGNLSYGVDSARARFFVKTTDPNATVFLDYPARVELLRNAGDGPGVPAIAGASVRFSTPALYSLASGTMSRAARPEPAILYTGTLSFMSNKVHLKGKRLIVRDWHRDEVDGMHRWYGDSTVRKFLSFGADSREESAKHLRETVVPSQNQHPRTEYYLAVELKETGQTIGGVGFAWVESGLAEIGYFFEPLSWGQGERDQFRTQ